MTEKIKKDLKNKNVKVQTMYFPTESRSKTSDEEIRRMHRVFPLEKRCWDDIVGRSQIKRIIGEKIDWEAWWMRRM